MMKSKNIFIFFFLFATLSLQAQLENSIFWEIKSDSSSKPSYIFGTHHLYDFEFVKNSAVILSKLEKSDIMFGEIVIDENDPSLIMKAALAMMMTNNSLDKLMSAEDYQATVDYCREVADIDISKNIMFNKLKPIAIQQIIMVAKYANMEKANGKTPSNSNIEDMNSLGDSMDAFFQQKAKGYKKEVKGLETVDYQLKALYDGYTLERQTEILLEMVYGEDESLEELKNMNELYQAQNLEKLYKFTKKSMRDEELKVLLTDRNENWMPIINKHIQKGKSLFIAVGAGHLPGELGILNLLKEKGYTIKPIKIEIN